jgi:DsbC/DsbD-like thiol-disulfide interchange protein
MRSLGVLFLAAVVVLGMTRLARAGQGDQLVQAELVADKSSIKPGQSFDLAVHLKIQPEWHIYWKNPGDAGLATKLKLELPPGFTSEPLQYPVPNRLDLPGDIINYVYQDEVTLLVRITPPADLPSATPVAITGKVTWLVCKDVCVPGSALVSLELPVSSDASPANNDLFQQWTDRLPRDRDPANVADVSANTDSSQKKITIRWKSVPSDIQWFPATVGVIVTDVNISTQRNTTEVSYRFPPDMAKISNFESVLAYTVDGKRIGLNLSDHMK